MRASDAVHAGGVPGWLLVRERPMMACRTLQLIPEDDPPEASWWRSAS